MSVRYSKITDDTFLLVTTEPKYGTLQTAALGPRGLFVVLQEWAKSNRADGCYYELDPSATPGRTVASLTEFLKEAQQNVEKAKTAQDALAAAGIGTDTDEFKAMQRHLTAARKQVTAWENKITTLEANQRTWSLLDRALSGEVQHDTPVARIPGEREQTYGFFLYDFLLARGDYQYEGLEVDLLEVVKG